MKKMTLIALLTTIQSALDWNQLSTPARMGVLGSVKDQPAFSAS